MTPRRLAFALLRTVFFAAALAYLGWFAYDSFDWNDLRHWFTWQAGTRMAVACVLFASTAWCSILGWRAVLAHLGYPRRTGAIGHVFCVTQIAKYLPGNVGHHVGRVALAKTSLEVPATVSIMSILQESALACLAAMLVGVSLLWLSTLGTGATPFATELPWLPLDFGALLAIALAGGVAALVAVNALRARLAAAHRAFAGWLLRATPAWPAVAAALPAYMAIYAINGVALWLVASSILDVDAQDVLLLGGAYALAWILGFILPGAPGGLGVREAALVILLDGTYPADAVISISVLARVSTVGADLLIFCVGLLLGRNTR